MAMHAIIFALLRLSIVHNGYQFNFHRLFEEQQHSPEIKNICDVNDIIQWPMEIEFVFRLEDRKLPMRQEKKNTKQKKVVIWIFGEAKTSKWDCQL